MRNWRICLSATALLYQTQVALSQNLVPNGGFEEFTTNCQFGLGYYQLEDWTMLDCGLPPGLAHACNTSLGNGGGVPLGSLGYQYAHGGDAFISTWTLRMNSQGGFPDGNPQKYATVELIEPLVAGQHYCLRLWMNMSDSSCYRTGAFHAFLWYGIPTICNYQDLEWDTYAAATWDISAVDTAEWTLLEGGFEAAGGETSLTLGAFQFEEEIDSVFVADHSATLGSLLAIYYIDDVELWACQVGVEEVNGSNDLIVYPDPAADFVTIGLPENGSTLELLAADGRLLSTVPANGPEFRLDVSTFPNGEYVLRVRRPGEVSAKRLTIVH